MNRGRFAVLCGAQFAASAVRFGLTWHCLRLWILFTLLTAAAFYDLATMEIPDGISIAAAVTFFVMAPWEGLLLRGLCGALVVGGGIALLSWYADQAMGRDTLGGGDIKLFAVLGLHLGVRGGTLATAAACLVGLIVCAVQHVEKGKPFPFAPSIAMGAFLAVMAG